MTGVNLESGPRRGQRPFRALRVGVMPGAPCHPVRGSPAKRPHRALRLRGIPVAACRPARPLSGQLPCPRGGSACSAPVSRSAGRESRACTWLRAWSLPVDGLPRPRGQAVQSTGPGAPRCCTGREQPARAALCGGWRVAGDMIGSRRRPPSGPLCRSPTQRRKRLRPASRRLAQGPGARQAAPGIPQVTRRFSGGPQSRCDAASGPGCSGRSGAGRG